MTTYTLQLAPKALPAFGAFFACGRDEEASPAGGTRVAAAMYGSPTLF